jgi:hypothetical protein
MVHDQVKGSPRKCSIREAGACQLRTKIRNPTTAAVLRKYKLLCVNSDTGHLEFDRHFEAANDGVAVELADKWRHNRSAELWRSYQVNKHWRITPR